MWFSVSLAHVCSSGWAKRCGDRGRNEIWCAASQLPNAQKELRTQSKYSSEPNPKEMRALCVSVHFICLLPTSLSATGRPGGCLVTQGLSQTCAQFLASTSEQKGQVNRFIWNIHRWKAAQREIKDDKESNQPNEKQTTNPVTHAGMRSPLRGTLTSLDT